MSWEILFVFVLLAGAIASFWMERVSADQTAMTVFGAVVIGGSLPFESDLPGIDELLRVFSSPAPVTIAAMFVLSAALQKTGVIDLMARGLGKLQNLGYRGFLLVLMLTVATASAFVNNTPVVMVFLPVVLTLSREMQVPASKILIPLSFASILGGTCTLVGTSTNILASGVLQEAGREPIGMFETAAVGLPLLATGMIYLLVVGDRLLPERETLTSLLGTAERKEFLVEAFVKDDSPLVGQRLGATSLIGGRDIRVIEVVRDNVAQRDAASTVLQVGDRLILGCRPAGVAHARSIEGLGIAATEGLEAISAHEGMIVEGIIGPNSSVVGQTVRQINFRQRFRMVLMALHRRGENLRETIDSIPLQAGDLLLMMGTDRAVQRLRDDDEILLLDYPPIPSRSRRRRAPLVIGVLIAVIVVSALDWLPISGAALIGAVVVLWAGVLTPTEGYASIEWSILMLIFGMLGLGLAMETSGAADLLARGLVAIADWSAIPRDLRLFVALATLYLLTSVLTETLSNNATVVLMTPVAIRLGLALSVDPRPFVIAACIASSASFSTPIGYQTNTYVYGVGGYRFSDFMRVGLPLNLLCFVVTLLVVPRVWSF